MAQLPPWPSRAEGRTLGNLAPTVNSSWAGNRPRGPGTGSRSFQERLGVLADDTLHVAVVEIDNDPRDRRVGDEQGRVRAEDESIAPGGLQQVGDDPHPVGLRGVGPE